MRLRLVAPTQRNDSANSQFIKRIPRDLKSRLNGMTLEVPVGDSVVPITIKSQTQAIRLSLRTADPSEVKRRHAVVVAFLEETFQELRSCTGPSTLTPKQQMAIAADHAKAFLSNHEEDPFSAPPPSTMPELADHNGGWKALVRQMPQEERQALLRDLASHRQEHDEEKRSSSAFVLLSRYPAVRRLIRPDLMDGLEALHGKDVDRALRVESLQVDAETRRLISLEMLDFLGTAERALEAMRGGDYSPVKALEVAPTFAPISVRPTSLSLRALFEAWWKEAERAGKSASTKESFGGAMEGLIAFLGHDDATRVTVLGAIGFKDHLVNSINPRTKKPLSMKTISGSYLGGLKVVFKWAVENKLISTNPFAEVKVAKGKRVRRRDSWFTTEERNAILSNASASVRRTREPWQRFEGRRWVPWLCAYTGARVGEMVQLRKKDIREKDGVWVLNVTPEAGTVKAGGAREVPIHEHLLEMGFREFVRKAPDGHLFMWSGDDRAAWRTAKNRIRDEIRLVVTDPDIQPNHGWRHTFKTIGREVGIQDFLLDAITGHTPRTEGDKYGGATVTAKARAMAVYPRYDAALKPY